METKVTDTIKLTTAQHRAVNDKLDRETTRLATDAAVIAKALKSYSPEKAAEVLQAEIDKQVTEVTAMDKLYNAEAKAAIEKAKRAAIPEAVRKFERPQDYQQQISNALAFLAVEGDRLTDEAAYSVLKPFFNDWDQMHLFERAILHQMHFATEYEARQAFPHTLGEVLDVADTYTALFAEAERLVENIFIKEKRSRLSGTIGEYTVQGGFGVDSYSDRAAQDRLIELAERIDALCDGSFTYERAALNIAQINRARSGMPMGPGEEPEYIWM